MAGPSLGSIMLLALGAALLVSAIVVFVRGKGTAPTLALVLVFGTLLSGTGTFGLNFMREFGAFLEASKLFDMISKDPGRPETQEKVVGAIAKGDVSEPVATVMLSSVLENAGPETGPLLERAANTGKSATGTALIRSARQRLHEREQAASDLATGLAKSGKLSETTIRRYDPVTRSLLAPKIGAPIGAPLGAPQPKQAVAPTVYRQGTLVVHGTWLCDLDSGREVNAGSGEDFWWEQVSEGVRYITPKNGAGFQELRERGIVSVPYSQLASLSYSTQRISAANENRKRIPSGTWIAYRTNEGRLGAFRVEEQGYDLRISYRTYDRRR